MKSSFLLKWQKFQFHNEALLQSVHFYLQLSSEMDILSFRNILSPFLLEKLQNKFQWLTLVNTCTLSKLSIL